MPDRLYNNKCNYSNSNLRCSRLPCRVYVRIGGDDVDGKPGDDVNRWPGDDVSRKPGDDVNRRPGGDVSRRQVDVDREPDEDVDREPEDYDEMQGRRADRSNQPSDVRARRRRRRDADQATGRRTAKSRPGPATVSPAGGDRLEPSAGGRL